VIGQPLVVVEGNGPSLFRTDWLLKFCLYWKQIHSIQKCDLTEVLNCHIHIFNETLGTLQGYEAQLYVEGILEPIQFAEWASSIVENRWSVS